MSHVIVLLVGVVTGAICMFLYAMEKLARAARRELELQSLTARARDEVAAAQDQRRGLTQREFDLGRRDANLEAQRADLARRIVSYVELQDENAILKRDLQNIDVNLHKLQLDGELRHQRQEHLDRRATDLAKRYLAETVKAVGAALNPNNFAACKQRLVDVIERCRDIGFDVPADEEARLVADLRADFERAVKAAFEREEQARIKAQIREEEKLRREVERELKQLDREQAAVHAALDKALADAHGAHTAEIEHLQARLAEAEAKSQRAISLAQQTKAGNVYIISNIGSFGPGIFKVGMTRRLEPMDRVRELGDASVPFPFDVHMMISCTDAPSLENALHRALHRSRLNKTNPRKEFFRADIDQIAALVREHHGEIRYVADPEALQFRQSQEMSEEDAEFIEQTYDAAEEDSTAVVDDA